MADEPLFIKVVKGLPQATRQVFGGMGGQIVQGVKTIPAIAQALAAAPFNVEDTIRNIPERARSVFTNTPVREDRLAQPRSLPLIGEISSYDRRVGQYENEPGYTPALAVTRAASEGVLDVAALGQGAQIARRFMTPTAKLRIAGRTLTLKDVHSPEGTRLFKTLTPAEQAKFTQFDQIQSRLANPEMYGLPKTGETDVGPAVQSFLKTSLKNFKESGGGLSIKRVGTGPDVPFEGFDDLSTKLLEKLKGRTTVSRQYIEDLSNSPDLKQAERDLIRRVLGEQDTYNGDYLYHGTNKTTLEAIKEQGIVPQRRGVSSLSTSEDYSKNWADNPYTKTEGVMFRVKKDVLDGKLVKRKGSMPETDRQFEVLTNQVIEPKDIEVFKDGKWQPLIPKSDQISVPDFANKVKSELLLLTGKKTFKDETTGVERKIDRWEGVVLSDELRGPVANYYERVYESPIKTSAGDAHSFPTKNYFAHTRIEDLPDGKTSRIIEIQSDLFQKGRLEGEATLGKDSPRYGGNFENAYQQAIRDGDTVKAQKNLDILEQLTPGYKKLVADRNAEIAKLEPYRNTWHERVIREEVKQAAKDGKTKLQFPTGETAMKIERLGETGTWHLIKENKANGTFSFGDPVTPETLKVGQLLRMRMGNDDYMVVTDVLGDGKFKAVPKDLYETTGYSKEVKAQQIERAKEQFDISGKVDTNNPIYKFYEKEVGKYLKNKYGAELVTDAQGVKWWEVKVTPEMKKLPIEAFGALALPSLGTSQSTPETRGRILKSPSQELFIKNK